MIFQSGVAPIALLFPELFLLFFYLNTVDLYHRMLIFRVD